MTAFDQASSITYQSKYIKQVKGQKALLYALKKNRCKAIQIFQDLQKEDGSYPEVVKNMYLQYVSMTDGSTVDTETISCVLESKKSFGVTHVCRSIALPIAFDTNSDQISHKSENQIEVLSKALSKFDNSEHFVILGHTDSRGDEYYNYLLSKRRANAVENVF
jgi:outer membrane protein OmpA-like peptidoglycan-associated protein